MSPQSSSRRSSFGSSRNSLSSSSISCPRCDAPFDTALRFPCIGSCGHTLCAACRTTSKRCDECRIPNSFSVETKNHFLLKIVEEKEKEAKEAEETRKVLCALCVKKIPEDAAWVCLICAAAEDKEEMDLQTLTDEISMISMCTACASSGHVHGDNNLQTLSSVKNILNSVAIQRKMRSKRRRSDEHLKQFNSAVEIARWSFEEFHKTCTRRSWMTGDEENFYDIEALLEKKSKELDEILMGRTKNLWILIGAATRATESVKKEKKKRLAEKLTTMERNKYTDLMQILKPPQNDVDGPSVPNMEPVNLDAWKKMSSTLRKATCSEFVDYYREKNEDSGEKRSRKRKL